MAPDFWTHAPWSLAQSELDRSKCAELLDIVASLSSCLRCRKSAPDDGREYFACVRGFPKA